MVALRLSKGLAGAIRVRPSIPTIRQAIPAVTALARHSSSGSGIPSTTPDPEVKAKSILDNLPGNSLVSKAAILSAGAGVSIAAISNELYVVNEESLVALCLLSVYFLIGKYGSPMYSEWATGQVNKFKEILNSARADHTQAVKERIESVQQLGSVVDITKALFEVSKESANLEAQSFELEQRTQFVAEARSVLDSWVRYEAQVKQRQQKELAESLIGKVKKELENPKALQQILQQSVSEVERIIAASKPSQ